MYFKYLKHNECLKFETISLYVTQICLKYKPNKQDNDSTTIMMVIFPLLYNKNVTNDRS